MDTETFKYVFENINLHMVVNTTLLTPIEESEQLLLVVIPIILLVLFVSVVIGAIKEVLKR